MTAEDDDSRDDRSEDTQDGADSRDGTAEGEDAAEDRTGDDEHDDRPDEDRVKDRGGYDDDTPGVTDARPGRDEIGEGSMPSDYHEAVAQRPVEVKLPETPDLSQDAESGDTSGSGERD